MQKIPSPCLTIEIYRKAIHLLGVIIPVLYHFIDQKSMIVAIASLLFLSFFMDMLRIKFDVTDAWFLKKMGVSQIFRSHEKSGFSALTFAFVGMMLCVLISSKPVFNLAVCILTFSDTAAAIVGILFGTKKINGKSIEGSCAFFIVSCILSLVIAHVYVQGMGFLLTAFCASLVATLVELFSKNSNINDNMSIPISVSIIMYAF
ncbi:diacylglycerol/polyprenol kinase family protein [Candidatus Bandiella euplotis]|uniref:Dolichol kinase n=1 Tax=Candidatus Bandiella euplotis TaxID=1664265 RepID=A0ABZ0UMZ1_9RICK|nr:SEC59/DGK1/VTE5 family protein [Candidatus Bandiella woodruffii]WPX96058.1 Putative dolichol kinase [Candidatus Bandiella woodruffii]